MKYLGKSYSYSPSSTPNAGDSFLMATIDPECVGAKITLVTSLESTKARLGIMKNGSTQIIKLPYCSQLSACTGASSSYACNCMDLGIYLEPNDKLYYYATQAGVDEMLVCLILEYED